MPDFVAKRNLFLVAAAILTVALFLALTLNGGPTVRAAVTTYVVDGSDTTATVTDCDGDGPNDYGTIAGALAAASAGDTILICPGTYAENIDYNKADLTVKNHPDATLASDVVLTGAAAGGIPVTVSASGFTLDPLTIEDNGNGANQAIHLKEAADGYLIKDVTILTDGFLQQVVFIDGADGGTIDGLSIVEDVSSDALDVPIGIHILSAVDGAIITNTDIDGIAGAAGNTAIKISGKDVTISETSIHDTAAGPDIGIIIDDPDADCTVADPCDYTLINVDISDWLSKGLEATLDDPERDNSLTYTGGTIRDRGDDTSTTDIGIHIVGGKTVAISSVAIRGPVAAPSWGPGEGIRIDDDTPGAACTAASPCTYTMTNVQTLEFFDHGIVANVELDDDSGLIISGATITPHTDADPDEGIHIVGGRRHVIDPTTVSSGTSDGYGDAAISIWTEAPAPNGIVLDDVTVIGQGIGAVAGQDKTGIHIQGADGFLLRDVEVRGFNVDGILVEPTLTPVAPANGTLDPSWIHDNLGDGVRLRCGQTFTIRDSTIESNTDDNIDVEGWNNLFIDNNLIAGAGDNLIDLADATCNAVLTETDTVVIQRNDLRIAGDGIVSWDSTEDVLVGGSSVTANTFSGVGVGVCNGTEAENARCYIENRSAAGPTLGDINAQSNIWGVTTYAEIEALVCHEAGTTGAADESSACDGKIDFSNAIFGGTITGTVDLQGWNGSGCDVGPPNFCESVVTINPSQTLATGEGAFSIDVDVGSHDVTVTHKGHLTERVCNREVIAGNPTNVGTITLRGGDVDGITPGTVTLEDVIFIAARANLALPYDARADINGDGVITLPDVILAAGNFLQSEDASC